MNPEMVFLLEAFNDVEADIIIGLLESSGIPARKRERGFQAGMRVIMGQALGLEIMVPVDLLEQAREVIREAGEDDPAGVEQD